MTCRGARRLLSARLDDVLEAKAARSLATHLTACPGCRRRDAELRSSLELLADLPRLAPPETVASRVRDRLEVERLGPGLALLFRPAWAARPLILPALVPAALVLVSVLAGALALGQRLAPPGPWVLAQVDVVRRAPLGSEANPLFPSTGVDVPRLRSRGSLPAALAIEEGTFFVETVVARDGSVAAVTLLDGDRSQAGALLDRLRSERFEPSLWRGRPVAVSVYRLISRMEVRAPLT